MEACNLSCVDSPSFSLNMICTAVEPVGAGRGRVLSRACGSNHRLITSPKPQGNAWQCQSKAFSHTLPDSERKLLPLHCIHFTSSYRNASHCAKQKDCQWQAKKTLIWASPLQSKLCASPFSWIVFQPCLNVLASTINHISFRWARILPPTPGLKARVVL